MQVPDVPLQIPRDAWIDSLEALGIPVRGHHMRQLEADPTGIAITYSRCTEKGNRVVGMDRGVATARIELGLAPLDMWAKDDDSLRPTESAQPQPSDRIKVREVPGGVVLDVPEKTRKLLVEFGWIPPVGDV